MAAKIKTEPPDEDTSPESLENRIIDICREHPTGISETVLSNQLQVPKTQCVQAFNRLLTKGRIDILQKGAQLLIRLKDTSDSTDVVSTVKEEQLVYIIIKGAGNKGIWVRDIRSKCNLTMTHLNKVLKALENKKHIKLVKSVAAPKKKIYLLYNLEPDQSITGGAWYSDQDFESEFVEVLNQQCYRFLVQKSLAAKQKDVNPIAQKKFASASSEEICNHIAQTGISKVQLSVEDVESILNTLIFDGKIEKVVELSNMASSSNDSDSVNVYRAVESLIKSVGLMEIPCGLCPVIDRCYADGEISPSTCIYMKEWLEY